MKLTDTAGPRLEPISATAVATYVELAVKLTNGTAESSCTSETFTAMGGVAETFASLGRTEIWYRSMGSGCGTTDRTTLVAFSRTTLIFKGAGGNSVQKKA